MLIRNDFAENCRLIWVFSNFVQFNPKQMGSTFRQKMSFPKTAS